MEIGELNWIFNPPAHEPNAELVAIAIKLPRDCELMAAIEEELKRHSNEGLLPGHWSARQRSWYINPDIWTCIHYLLVKRDIRVANLDAYILLNELGRSTDMLQCQQHPHTYIIWLCAVMEEVIGKYERRPQATNAELTWLKSERERINALRKKWQTIIDEPSAETDEEKIDNADNWLNEIEEEINSFYRRLQQQKD